MAGMVLLPGVMCDAGLWQEIREELNEYGPLVYGDLSQASSLQAMALACLEQSPARFTLVGFSMGGFVAREMIRQAPERVERLILIATSSQQDSEQARSFKAATVKTLLSSGGLFRGLGQKAIALSLSEAHAGDARLQQHIHAMSLRMGREAYCRQLLMARESDTATLHQITSPTLVIAAAQDRMRTLRESQVLQQAIPGAVLEVIEESGHMIPLEQPKALAAVMKRWLEANPV